MASRHMDYSVMLKRSFLLGVALFVVGIVGEALAGCERPTADPPATA